jgi:hypothetical protein
MMAPEDHENMAMADLLHDSPRDAPVSAVLALASALNRLAEAHESVSNSIIDLRSARPPRSGWRGSWSRQQHEAIWVRRTGGWRLDRRQERYVRWFSFLTFLR